MTEDVKTEIFDRLDALAAKMGVAAEHLWGVLVKQHLIYGISAVLGIIAVLALGFYAGRQARKIPGDLENSKGEPNLKFVLYAANALSVVAAVLIFFMAEAVARLINPEYYALQELLDTFR